MDCPQPKCATKCATFSKTKSTVFSSQDGSTQLSTQRTPQETPHRSGLLNVRSHASPPRHESDKAHRLPQSLAKRKYRGLCQAGNNFWTAATLAAVLGGKMEGTGRKITGMGGNACGVLWRFIF